jgi:hypothetical protein
MTIRPGGRCAVPAGKIEHHQHAESKHNVVSTIWSSVESRGPERDAGLMQRSNLPFPIILIEGGQNQTKNPTST